MAWSRRLFEELERGSDLLSLNLLGTQFVVQWGPAVTRKQREKMRSAWARCGGSGQPLLPPLPGEPAAGQPFTASVTCTSKKHDGGTFHLRAASFEELAETLTSRLTLAAILANAGELLMLHACGVADPETGAVVALVAKSGTGKTTAACVLAQTFGYVTDETVAIDWDGSVVPYPKPLSVKQGSGQPKRQLGPDQLGLLPVTAAPFIQAIVLLDRVQGGQCEAPTVTQVPLADAVLALVPESSSLADFEVPLQSLCHLISSVGGVWRATYSEAADLPAALGPLFRTQSGGDSAELGWEAATVADAAPRTFPRGGVRRATAKDAVAIGNELLVMFANEIVKLTGIGPAIWEASAYPVLPDELAEEIGRVHGMPEGYRAAVEVATAQLIAKSVLERT